ncbi:MAG: energy transducer TonB [Bacteroidota bacterium]|nr:energy transducer TonB [Bacteroidota bacterium]
MNRINYTQISLLDLIFDQRNKEYGAYVLRKQYPARLFTSMGLTLLFAVLLSVGILTENAKTQIQKVVKLLPVGDTRLSSYQQVTPPAHPRVHKRAFLDKSKLNTARFIPRIVTSLKINNSLKIPMAPDPNDLTIATPDAIGGGSAGTGPGVPGIPNAAPSVVSRKPASHKVLEQADVMPQFPGGIKALMKYLQRNIHPPMDVDPGQEVSVRVKFIVNFDGKLQGFQVLQSGGTAFDDEVLRVLGKMPDWIPGRNQGEKVSEYYVVPVRFTAGF